jgi:hypothetical protein
MKQLGRSSHIWEDNTNINLREKGHEDVDWINLVEDTDQ